LTTDAPCLLVSTASSAGDELVSVTTTTADYAQCIEAMITCHDRRTTSLISLTRDEAVFGYKGTVLKPSLDIGADNDTPGRRIRVLKQSRPMSIYLNVSITA
jgi:hypothetical protein